MARVLRAPLLHFLLIGGALLGLRTWWWPEGSRESRPRIVIGPADLARLREGWVEEHGTPPGRAAEHTLVRDAIDEEILYREALARGFDRHDETVRERLVRLGGFVGEETGDRNSLERAARRLGLERSDLVIRRHLVEMMRLAAGWVGPADLPSEADLEVYRAEHAGEFTPPARIRLTQVYLSGDAHGPDIAVDARTLLDELRRTGSGPADAAGRGDAFIRGAQFDGTRADLERTYGPGFAAALDGQPPRTWVGPITSSYGLHLVWIDEQPSPPTPSVASIRGRLLQRWLQERSERRREETMQALRARYDVEIAAY
ncbi:MAG TPA: peptidylprolyl isomerase [Candidatus Nitrosopolaris sp.]|nr:peptidylprolyl isomerase [Candidatus Nitrosopolaris sp.]